MKIDIDIERFTSEQIISPQLFWKYLDDENDKTTFCALSVNYNSHYGSIVDETLLGERIKEFSRCIYSYWEKGKCNSFLACHYENRFCWRPPKISKKRKSPSEECLRSGMISYLQEHSLWNYSGAVLLENGIEMAGFVDALMTSPTMFAYQNIYIYCGNAPLVVEFSHHHNVIFYSMMKGVLRDIATCLDEKGFGRQGSGWN